VRIFVSGDKDQFVSFDLPIGGYPDVGEMVWGVGNVIDGNFILSPNQPSPQQSTINEEVQALVEEMSGNPMIFDLFGLIKDWLENGGNCGGCGEEKREEDENVVVDQPSPSPTFPGTIYQGEAIKDRKSIFIAYGGVIGSEEEAFSFRERLLEEVKKTQKFANLFFQSCLLFLSIHFTHSVELPTTCLSIDLLTLLVGL